MRQTRTAARSRLRAHSARLALYTLLVYDLLPNLPLACFCLLTYYFLTDLRGAARGSARSRRARATARARRWTDRRRRSPSLVAEGCTPPVALAAAR
eukprot:scaffold31323_cov57-Phaeocystis_antarctica.AAC.1